MCYLLSRNNNMYSGNNICLFLDSVTFEEISEFMKDGAAEICGNSILKFAKMTTNFFWSGAGMSRLNPKIFRISFTSAFVLLIFLLSNPYPARSADYALTVTPVGAGVGTVNSAPSGITCQSGVSGGCSAAFNDVDPVTLQASPDWKALFTVWGGACSGTGDCVLTLSADSEVTATFSPNFQATVLGHSMVQYASLDNAYADANEGSTIAAHVYTFMEDLTLDRPIFIRFYGGREGTEYLSHPDSYFTTLQGTLDLQQGSVEVDSLIIQ